MLKNLLRPTINHSLGRKIRFSNCNDIKDCIFLTATIFNMGARLYALYYNISFDDALEILYKLSKSESIEFCGINSLKKSND